MKQALVTGATGFIGARLSRALISRGVNVKALVRNLDTGWRTLGGNVHIIPGDILEPARLTDAVQGVDTIFHLASKTHHFSDELGTVEDYYRINVIGTRNLLEACCKAPIERLVYFSSVKAMTETASHPIDERFPPSPTTIYGKTKLEAERLVNFHAEAHSLSACILRLPLVYGPGNKGNMLSMIRAIDRERFFLVGDGSNLRSMVYVDNVVDAALCSAMAGQPGCKTYIVTDGVDYTLKAIYQIFASALGRTTRSIFIPFRFAKIAAKVGDVGRQVTGRRMPFNTDMFQKLTGSLVFSSALISNEIGFRPRHTLKTAAAETIQWYRCSREIDA